MIETWKVRSPFRIPDDQWKETMRRVQCEFNEMPCLRVTVEQARTLFGLAGSASDWVLTRLEEEGFLVQTPEGQYVRRNTAP